MTICPQIVSRRGVAPWVPSLRSAAALDDGPGETGDRGTHLGILDLREGPHQLDRRPLTSAMLDAVGPIEFGIQLLEEIADIDTELARDLKYPTGADTIGTGLIFLDLLIGDVEGRGKLFLGQAQLRAALADALADMLVDAPGPHGGGLGLGSVVVSLHQMGRWHRRGDHHEVTNRV